MGERVLWDFMLEGIPGLIKVDMNVIKTDASINQKLPFHRRAAMYIKHHFPNCKAVIQNGSYFGLVQVGVPVAIIIQDNLRMMSRPSVVQERNLRHADFVVTNGNDIDVHYSDYTTTQIPLGVAPGNGK